MSRPRSRATIPLAWDKNGHAVSHGTYNGYKRGCGCDPCYQAYASSPGVLRNREIAAASGDKAARS